MPKTGKNAYIVYRCPACDFIYEGFSLVDGKEMTKHECKKEVAR